MNSRKDFINNLFADNWHEIMRRSLNNYHVQGFTSLLMFQQQQLTIRLYICETKRHNLNNSFDPNDNTLLIHNHKFNFICETLIGEMYNMWYEETDQYKQFEYYKYKYTSALKDNDGMRLDFLGKKFLFNRITRYVPQNTDYAMRAHELHKICVPNDKLTAMLFWQHAPQPTHEPILYSRVELPTKPSIEGLYTRITTQELKRYRELILDNL